MEKQEKQASLVLKYAKRRFDGGSEIDQIRFIERHNAIAKLEKMAQLSETESPVSFTLPILEAPSAAEAVESLQAETPEVSAPVEAPVEAPISRLTKIRNLCIAAPLAIAVGAIGAVTALLAIVVFQQANNLPLVEQARGILRDCRQTIKKGVLDTVSLPVRALQVLTENK